MDDLEKFQLKFEILFKKIQLAKLEHEEIPYPLMLELRNLNSDLNQFLISQRI